MAMGGSHKVINSGNRGRPYGLMLLLAFGAALIGVMVLHKLKERRIFNLLVKEKDHELISLQLLLQKEREYTKELKGSIKEMKAKIYSLRTQKMELDRRLLEMQSTINSLKDEQKVMESALKEKQNEIKMQREEEIDSGKEISQLIALKESLKQKEAEIEDLKHLLGHPVKVWSVSSDDPSNPSVNLISTLNMAEKDKTDISLSKEKVGELSKSTNFMGSENLTKVEGKSEKRVGITNSREVTVEPLQKLEISQAEGFKNEAVVGGKKVDEGPVKKNGYSQEEGGFGKGEKKNVANSTAIVDDVANLSKLADRSSDEKDENEHKITKHRELGKPENSQDDRLEVQAITIGEKKLEILDPRTDASSRLRGKRGHAGRTKGKRWRTLAKNRDSEDNQQSSTRSRRFDGLDQDQLSSRRESQASYDGSEEGQGRETKQEVKKAVDSTVAKLLKARNHGNDAEYLMNRDVNTDPNQQLERENEMSKTSQNSLGKEVLRNTNLDGESTNVSSYGEKQKLEEVRQPEEEASGVQKKMSRRDNSEQENIAKQVKDENERQMIDGMENADIEEPETESSNGDSFRESASNLEEEKEEYKEEIDEYEF